MANPMEILSTSGMRRNLDGVLIVQAISFLAFHRLARMATEVPSDPYEPALPDDEIVSAHNERLLRFCFYASAREQAERVRADRIHPVDWVPYARDSFRRLDGKVKGSPYIATPSIFGPGRTALQEEIFSDMLAERVFAEGMNEDATGRDYALMVATGMVAMQQEDIGQPPVGVHPR